MNLLFAAHLDLLIITAFVVAGYVLVRRRIAMRFSETMPALITVLFIAMLAAGNMAAILISKNAQSNIIFNLKEFASIYGVEMRRLGHAKMTLQTSQTDPLYLHLIEAQLEWQKINRQIADIYTLRRLPDGRTVFMVDAETDYDRDGRIDHEREQRTAIGEVYTQIDDNLVKKTLSGQTVFTGWIVTDRWGTWVSAFAPIVNEAGQVEALVGVDYEAARYFIVFLISRYVPMGLFILLIALLGLLAWGMAFYRWSAKKAAEAKDLIENQREFLQVTLHAIADGIIATDQNGRIQEMNAVAESLTGWERTEALHREVNEVFQTVDERTHRVLPQPSASRRSLLITRCGGECPVLETWASLTRADGKTVGSVLVFRDLTEESSRQALLSSLIDAIPDMVFFKSLEGVYISCNTAFAEYLGRSKEEIIGRTDYDIFIRPSADEFRNTSRKVLHSCQAEHFVQWVTLPNGERRLVDTLKSPVHNPGGSVFGVLGISRDLTQQQAHLERIEHQASYLRAILDTAPYLAWMKDKEGRFLATNQKFAEAAGLRKVDELVGLTDFDVWPADLAKSYMDDDRRVIERGEFKIIEEQIDFGEQRTLMETFKSPVRDSNGQILGTVGFSRDITAQKLLEKEIKKRESLFSSLFRHNCAIMLLLDPTTGAIRDANEQAVRFYGYSREELLAMNIVALNTLAADEVLNALAVTREQSNQQIFVRHRLKNGEIRDVEIVSSPIEVDGEIFLNPIIHDITEAKRIERERALAQAQLLHSSKLASIGTLAAGVAHEINNPLAIVRGQLAIVKKELIGDEYLALFERQERAVERIAKIVEGLRTFAREDSDDIETVDLRQVIDSTSALIEPILRKSGIQVFSRISCTCSTIKGNLGKLQQVLMNVLTNCHDALANEPAGLVEMVLEEQDGWLILSISDNGRGIPEDHLTRIFDPFFTTQPPGKGTGLGLSVCSSIIRSFGGDISIVSAEGVGTVVTIMLPCDGQRTMA